MRWEEASRRRGPAWRGELCDSPAPAGVEHWSGRCQQGGLGGGPGAQARPLPWLCVLHVSWRHSFTTASPLFPARAGVSSKLTLSYSQLGFHSPGHGAPNLWPTSSPGIYLLWTQHRRAQPHRKGHSVSALSLSKTLPGLPLPRVAPGGTSFPPLAE